MVITQTRSRRKPTGGRYKGKNARKKKRYEIGRLPTMTKVGEKTKKKKIRVRGGREKQRILIGDVVNVSDPQTKKTFKVKIKTIVDNPANRHFIRRNIITKGCIVETEKGKVKITSRPGQEGIINGVLV